jgi:hypothetical protein
MRKDVFLVRTPVAGESRAARTCCTHIDSHMGGA